MLKKSILPVFSTLMMMASLYRLVFSAYAEVKEGINYAYLKKGISCFDAAWENLVPVKADIWNAIHQEKPSVLQGIPRNNLRVVPYSLLSNAMREAEQNKATALHWALNASFNVRGRAFFIDGKDWTKLEDEGWETTFLAPIKGVDERGAFQQTGVLAGNGKYVVFYERKIVGYKSPHYITKYGNEYDFDRVVIYEIIGDNKVKVSGISSSYSSSLKEVILESDQRCLSVAKTPLLPISVKLRLQLVPIKRLQKP
ncbi:hypothetical protein HYR99_08760 [Candidatus Poribacteria bacterium]|nr:hypothetical protein [Candidatus Poribacteria bacterium]